MKIKALKQHIGQPVIVEWEDCCGVDDWNGGPDLDDVTTVTVRTLGYLASVTARVMKVCRHLGEDNEYAGTQAIPMGMVLSVTVLEKKQVY